MQRGEGAANVPTLKTSSCGGCSGASPCATCGGDKLGDDAPPQQALDWGVLTTPTGADAFWRIAYLGHSVRTAGANDRSESWLAMERSINAAQSFYSYASQGENAKSGFIEGHPARGR